MAFKQWENTKSILKNPWAKRCSNRQLEAKDLLKVGLILSLVESLILILLVSHTLAPHRRALNARTGVVIIT